MMGCINGSCLRLGFDWRIELKGNKFEKDIQLDSYVVGRGIDLYWFGTVHF